MTNNKNIYALIVIYNKNYKESITYNCLKKINNINIIICDNSIKDFNNKSILKENIYKYISMNGNKGLSKAYNVAINSIDSNDGLLCLFDDDTYIPEKYFDELTNLYKNSPADIYLPIVYDERGLLSPSLPMKRAKSLDEINNKNITAINSGMAIDLKVFKDYRYNENYFLDYVDHNFLRDMKKLNKKIKIMKIKIKQTFAGNDVSNLESSLVRFNIFKKDFRLFCSDSFKNKVEGEFRLLLHRSYLTYKFKTLKFIFNI